MTEAGNNYSEKKTQLHISVRNLVEFIFREGDIDNRSSRAMSADAMMEGTRIHRKIQGSMGKEYQAEVPLSLVVEGDLYELTVEGRADGIFTEDGKCFVDEIKGMYRRVELFEKPELTAGEAALLHLAFSVQNVDEAYAAALRAGAVSLRAPEELPLDAKPFRITLRVAFVRGPAGEELEFCKQIVGKFA